ncbi:MAG: IS30 family transposase [Planctomycetes bacterium]|nr:IS30 family transposase [Planctomycetota bacterium]
MPYKHLTDHERFVIYHLIYIGLPKAQIARRLKRDKSTISREIKRNTDATGQYLYDTAERLTRRRRRAAVSRPRTDDPALMKYVEAKIKSEWSPDEIAGRLRTKPPKKLKGKTISHSTIYRWIWSDPQRAESLKKYLRVGYKKRRKVYGKPSKQGQIPNRVSIEERPEIVEERSRIGDWEGDTVVGKGRTGYIMTNVERFSLYLVARKLKRATAQAVADALYQSMRRMPANKRKTETFDNGREFAKHETIARLLNMDVYFAHPYSSWERGTNENTNGLLRQYLPKSRDFSTLTDAELARYVWKLNNRPRKCLNYKTPAEVFHNRIVALRM